MGLRVYSDGGKNESGHAGSGWILLGDFSTKNRWGSRCDDHAWETLAYASASHGCKSVIFAELAGFEQGFSALISFALFGKLKLENDRVMHVDRLCAEAGIKARANAL